jgi:hypothetical protein
MSISKIKAAKKRKRRRSRDHIRAKLVDQITKEAAAALMRFYERKQSNG